MVKHGPQSTDSGDCRLGPRHPRLAEWGSRAALPIFDGLLSRAGLHRIDSSFAKVQLAAVSAAVGSGRETYVAGIGAGFHNAGFALVRITRGGTIELVSNDEEERYSAIKHHAGYPQLAVDAIKQRMRTLDLDAEDLAACVSNWDFAAVRAAFVRTMLEEAPASIKLLRAELPDQVMSRRLFDVLHVPRTLGRQLGLGRRMPILGIRHHDSHAYFSYAVSPFASGTDPVALAVIDGAGEDASTSLYDCQDGRVTLLQRQGGINDSLGVAYGMLSSTQGGWPLLSSEGRYMGAAAYGDGDRLTNRYYEPLRQLFHLGPEGRVQTNRALADWMRFGLDRPYSKRLIEILGEPIPLAQMWNPDAVLNVDDVRHAELTRERVDKAAAVQMLFEDALLHIVDHLLRATRSSRLVLTGGTALNCVANMRVLEHFDEDWYERELGMSATRLHVWAPPVPGDAGTPLGAAYAFAMLAGARPGPPLRHAFHCGEAATTAAIQSAVDTEATVHSMAIGDCRDHESMARVADLLAYQIANGSVIGLFQGVAETGPRALGHRSILANPCDPDTLQTLNERVKYRERIRPLAPMLTRAAAERFFHLEDGASDDEYNAYRYMVITARARPDAHTTIPAVIHHDGTGRLQIVSPDVEPFCHEYLLAMGRRTGAEVSVNTSLNVGAPMAQTPAHAVGTLLRARGMDGLLTIGSDGQALLVWQDDHQERLLGNVRAWAHETGAEELLAPELSTAE